MLGDFINKKDNKNDKIDVDKITDNKENKKKENDIDELKKYTEILEENNVILKNNENE